MARALAFMYLAGATLALVSTELIHVPGMNKPGLVMTSVSGYPAALLLLGLGGRWPTWAFHVFLVFGTFVTTLGVYFGGGHNGTAGASFYIWVALYSFYFYTWRVGTVYLAIIGLAYATALWIQRGLSGPGE